MDHEKRAIYPHVMENYQMSVIITSIILSTIVTILLAVVLGLNQSASAGTTYYIVIAAFIISLITWLILIIGGGIVLAKTHRYVLRVGHLQIHVDDNDNISYPKTVKTDEIRSSLGFY